MSIIWTILLLCLLTLEFIKGECEWSTSLLSLYKDNGRHLWKISDSLPRMENSAENVVIKNYLKIEVFCNRKKSFSAMVSNGTDPVVKLEVVTPSGSSLHHVETVVVEENECLCFTNRSFQQIRNCFEDDYTKCISTKATCPDKYCPNFWAAPLNFATNTLSVKVTIESSGIGGYLPTYSASFGKNVLGLHSNETLQPKTLHDVSYNKSIFGPLSIATYAEHIMSWSFPLDREGTFATSWTAFEMYTVNKLNMRYLGLTDSVCSDEAMVNHILTLTDRMILATKYGVLEAFHGTGSGFQIVLSMCVKQIFSCYQYTHSKNFVAVIDESTQDIYISSTEHGTPSAFCILQDIETRSLCSWLRTTSVQAGCWIRSIAIPSSLDNKLWFLIQTEKQNVTLLVTFDVQDLEWNTVYNSSLEFHNLDDRKMMLPMESRSKEKTNLSLNGISFTLLKSRHLFAWGNALLYSPNPTDGELFFKIQASFDGDIVVFQTSTTGFFAFLTTKNEVWFGTIGSLNAVRLESRLPESIKTIFFDPYDQLHKLHFHNTTQNSKNRIMREKIDVKSILASVKLKHGSDLVESRCSNEYPCQAASCGKVEDVCSAIKGGKNITEDRCPFSHLELSVNDIPYYSRVPKFLSCSSIEDKAFSFSWDDLPNYHFGTQVLSTAGNDLRTDCLWDASSYTSQRWPKHVSLSQGHCFKMKLQLWKNQYFPSDEEFNDYSLQDIQLISHVSLPDILSVEISVERDYLKSNVQFKLNICNTDYRMKQMKPGIDQLDVVAHFRILGAQLYCLSEKYYEREDIQV